MIVMGTDPLSRFINRAMAEEFEWGRWDCLLFLGEWIAARRGFDPGAEWRGTYRTALQATRIVINRGGMVKHFGDAVADYGLSRSAIPARGDVAIVRAPEGETGAIVLGKASVVRVKQAGGILISREPIVAAWSV